MQIENMDGRGNLGKRQLRICPVLVALSFKGFIHFFCGHIISCPIRQHIPQLHDPKNITRLARDSERDLEPKWLLHLHAFLYLIPKIQTNIGFAKVSLSILILPKHQPVLDQQGSHIKYSHSTMHLSFIAYHLYFYLVFPLTYR